MFWLTILYHKVKQLFIKPTCKYCSLACKPIYTKERCEICDEISELDD